MKDISKTYKELGLPYFKEVFDLIDAVLIKHEIPYYLIGFSAVSLQLAKTGVRPSRGTRDIDFALMLSSILQYQHIAADLSSKGFNRVSAPWTFYHPGYNVAIDLLPFGEIEQTFTENFTERLTDLHMLGFKEVLAKPETVQIEAHIVNVPPLPGMIILKLISWSDRPEDRQNDLADILTIIKAFYDHDWYRILEVHADLMPEEGELIEIFFAARVLGREAGIYLLQSTRIKERILKVLENNLTNNLRAPIAIEWARILDNTVAHAQQILKYFLRGLTDTIEKNKPDEHRIPK